ncbi:MAG TPA: cyclase family protein [Cyclobacteriaceae bacterium]|nr:cyclase family protein [Cyclobacteriaceae bacterium]
MNKTLSIIFTLLISYEASSQSAPKSTSKAKFIDVSHEIENGMTTYKGLPPPVITPLLTREDSKANYSEGVSFLISKIDMVANTGTYMDTPFHRYEDGYDLAEVKLEDVAYVRAEIVRVDGMKIKHIDESYFKKTDLRGKAVLINTGWSANWRTDAYFSNHPHLTAGAAKFLVDSGVKIVAIDTYNIDDTSDGTRPAHSILLKAGIPIVEHLCNLENIPSGQTMTFTAVPIKIKDFSTFPVRAFVRIE